MATLPNQSTNQGMFVPTNIIYDAQRVLETDVNSKDFRQLLVRLYQTVNIISLAINAREIGYYPNEEFVVGNLYYNPSSAAISDFRPIFRKTVNTGGIVGALNSKAHGLTIDTTWQFVRIYGVACKTSTKAYWPMPNSNITVYLDDTYIYIDNFSGVEFDVSSVVLEYSKTL